MTPYDEFLKRLTEDQTQKENIVKITVLSFIDEVPIQEITGRVTSGSLQLNGNSAVRRTCNSVTIISDIQEEEIDAQWALENKFSLQLGVYNFIDPNYDPIIWFPLGVYVISGFSHSKGMSSITITISGKDKMCLLDGSISGKFPGGAELDVIEMEDPEAKEWTINKVTIPELIKQLVHTYAKEPYHNIVINDLEQYGFELMSYRGKDPLYLFVTSQEGGKNVIIHQMMFNDNDIKVRTKEGQEVSLDDDSNIKYFSPKTDLFSQSEELPTLVSVVGGSNKTYNLMKLEYGDVIGYHLTDLIYAGKLNVNIGDSIVSALDKIKNQLGQFEYFYDVNGQFVFQKKKNRLQENYSNIIATGTQLEYKTEDYYTYEFTNNKLFTAISQTPQIAKVKNDYTIWGQFQGGSKSLVVMRYAIDKKPTEYTNITGKKFKTPECDWREIIYQMAKDFQQTSFDATDPDPEEPPVNLQEQIAKNNPDVYPSGITGYEDYYVEIYSFWRDLYDGTRWKEDVLNQPETLKFWFDFLDPTPGSELEKVSVKKIGNRNEAKKETAVTGIYYPPIPEVIYQWSDDTKNPDDLPNLQAYRIVQVPDSVRDLFSVSSRGLSAIEKTQEYLQNNAFCSNTINLTSIPIYHLELNGLIRVDLDDIKGDYIVNSFNIPLTYNGTMGISATKVIDNIY